MNRRVFSVGVLSAFGWSIVEAGQATTQLRINGRRLNEHLSALAEFGKNPQGGVSRLAYSEADLRAREYVMGLMRAAKLRGMSRALLKIAVAAAVYRRSLTAL